MTVCARCGHPAAEHGADWWAHDDECAHRQPDRTGLIVRCPCNTYRRNR